MLKGFEKLDGVVDSTALSRFILHIDHIRSTFTLYLFSIINVSFTSGHGGQFNFQILNHFHK